MPITTSDAAENTRLAVERTRLAYERTLMAWVRTSVALISFGFTIYKFFQFQRETQEVVAPQWFGPRPFGMLMISIGVVSLLLATTDHRQHLQDLRTRHGHLPRSNTAILAALITLQGIVALLAVVFGL